MQPPASEAARQDSSDALQRSRRRRVPIWTRALVTLIGFALLAAPVAVLAETATRRFDVRSQGAATGVADFARQADIQLLLTAAAAGGKRTNALHGAFDVSTGLELLLKNTGLRARPIAPRIYAVVAVEEAPPERVARPVEPVIATSSPAVVGELVVTGALIRGTNSVSAAPVTTVSAADLRFQGVLNLEEAINRLPQVRADSTQFTNGSDANGRAKINLRNLGDQRTLILMDGQRVLPVQATDLNIIPASLVRRVEVLTGGASTTYGSDAVAGVVNFILDKTFDGLRLDASYSVYQHDNDDMAVRGLIANFPNVVTPSAHVTDGVRKDATLTAGRTFADGRGNISLFGGYRVQHPVRWADRDYSACRVIPTDDRAGATCAINTIYTHYSRFEPLSGPSAGQALYVDRHGGEAFAPASQSADYGANTRESFNFMRSDERRSAGVFARFAFSEAAELHAAALYMKDVSSSQFYPYINLTGSRPGGFQINCDNPFLSASQAAGLCGSAAGTHALISTEYTAIMSGPGSLPLRAEAVNEDYRISVGLTGVLGGAWRYDLNALTSRVSSSLSDDNQVDPEKLNNALNVVLDKGTPVCAAALSGVDPDCVPANVFREGAIDPAFYRYAYRNYVWYDDHAQTDVTASLSGDLGDYGLKSPWAERGVAVAVGGEYRLDVLKQKISPAAQAFEALSPPLRGRQSVYELYGELQVPIATGRPLLDNLEVVAGVRHSKYSTRDALLPTWKYELQYKPVRDWLLRASLNRAARAPNISELYTAAFRTVSLSDPCAGAHPTASLSACAFTGVSAAQYGRVPDCPEQLCRTYGGNGNPDLRPESAKTVTAGLVYTPSRMPGLLLSADYYRIAVKGYIGPVQAADVFANCLDTGDAYYCRFIHRAAGTGALYGDDPADGYIAVGAQNTALLLNEGVDVQAAYNLDLGEAGKLAVNLVGSRLIKAGGNSAPGEVLANCAGYFGAPTCYAPRPKWRHDLRVTWRAPWRGAALSANWRHIGGTRLAANSGDPAVANGAALYAYAPFTRLKTYDYFDVGASVKVSSVLTARLAVNNLFDRTPPVVPSSFVDGTTNNPNTYTGVYDPLGRNVQLAFTLDF